MNLKKPLLAALSLGCFGLGGFTAVPAHAERDIAYSARYYLKPGSRGTSHFYIYTINPDGSGRKQLTSGQNDDQYPQWSPDGKQILFVRNADSSQSQLCIISANGGRVRKVMMLDEGWAYLRWTPGGQSLSGIHFDYNSQLPGSAFHILDLKGKSLFRNMGAHTFDWSPSGSHLALHYGFTGKTRIVERKTRREVQIKEVIYGVAWLNDATLLGIEGSPADEKYIRSYDLTGKLRLRSPISIGDDDPAFTARLKIIPGKKSPLFIEFNEASNSGALFAYKSFSLGSPVITPLCEGTSLRFSPDASRYAVIQYHDLTPYDKKNGGRQVYTAPLQIGATAGGTPKNIVSGLVYVTGCDWRKAAR